LKTHRLTFQSLSEHRQIYEEQVFKPHVNLLDEEVALTIDENSELSAEDI